MKSSPPGNLLQDQRGGVTDCHGYDAFMRHAAFSRYSGTQNCGAPTGGATSSANYRFNGLNQRSFKNANGVSTRYVYGPGGEPIVAAANLVVQGRLATGSNHSCATRAFNPLPVHRAY